METAHCPSPTFPTSEKQGQSHRTSSLLQEEGILAAKLPEKQEVTALQGFRRHPPPGQKCAGESGTHVKEGRDMAPPRWAAGLGRPELKDISGNCPARDMSLHPKAPPVQARRYREENYKYTHSRTKYTNNLTNSLKGPGLSK